MSFIQNSPALSRGYATLQLSNTASVMRNRFDFTLQKLLCGVVRKCVHNMLPFPQQTKLNQRLFALHNWEANGCVSWWQYVEGDHFKIHVISQQTASEMDDHMIHLH